MVVVLLVTFLIFLHLGLGLYENQFRHVVFVGRVR